MSVYQYPVPCQNIPAPNFFMVSPAVTTVNIGQFQPTNTPVISTPIKAKGKGKKQKDIIYPIFALFAGWVTDPFWEELLRDASYGKMPKKFTFNEMTLSYHKGQRSHAQILYSTVESASEAVQFFRMYGAIYSPYDQQLALAQQQHNRANTQQVLSWASASSKTRISLVSNYVTEVKNSSTYNMTNEEAEQLLETIELGVANKVFGKENIVVQGHKIIHIQGLCWDPHVRMFYPDPNLKSARTSKSKTASRKKGVREKSAKDNTPVFRTNWNKLLIKQLSTHLSSREKQEAYVRNHHSAVSMSDNSEDETMMSSDSEGDY